MSINPTQVEIRKEHPSDQDAIHDVLRSAFPTDSEARLVSLLREREKTSMSLVAVVNDRIVGHLLFSPITVENAPEGFRGVGLAPVTVHSEFQNQGIGSRLIREGLERCKEAGYDLVVVLGHPSYYPRFGFLVARQYGLGNEYEATDAFMVLGLTEGILDKVAGLVQYAPEFREVDC